LLDGLQQRPAPRARDRARRAAHLDVRRTRHRHQATVAVRGRRDRRLVLPGHRSDRPHGRGRAAHGRATRPAHRGGPRQGGRLAPRVDRPDPRLRDDGAHLRLRRAEPRQRARGHPRPRRDRAQPELVRGVRPLLLPDDPHGRRVADPPPAGPAGHPVPGAGDRLAAAPRQGAGRRVRVVVGTAFFMMFSPTKWTHHFGVYAGIGAAIAALGAMAISASAVRSARNRTVFLGVLLVVLALAFAGPNGWWYVSSYGIP